MLPADLASQRLIIEAKIIQYSTSHAARHSPVQFVSCFLNPLPLTWRTENTACAPDPLTWL